MTRAALECARCRRRLTRRSAIVTRAGVLCRAHADRLPPHLRRPPKPSKKGTTK
jgi:hypothetical protein